VKNAVTTTLLCLHDSLFAVAAAPSCAVYRRCCMSSQQPLHTPFHSITNLTMEEPTAKRPRPHQPHHHHNARPKPAHDAATDAARDASLLASSNNPFLPMFLTFRAELDEHHDRRERVIKASRDITALSKKMIFSLQRCVLSHPPLPADPC
jgi:hypothetical protein